MKKIKVKFLAGSFYIMLPLLLVWLNYSSKEFYQVSKDCRSYNIEVETLESWEEKIAAQKLKVIGFSGWNICGSESVKCVNLNKSYNASIIKIYGTPEYIFKKNIISGTIGFELRNNDCIISEALAQALFGSTNIENEKVFLDGSTYFITSIIKSNYPFICLPLKEGKIENIEIVLENRKNADKIVYALLN